MKEKDHLIGREWEVTKKEYMELLVFELKKAAWQIP
jgi:hypothetical protein